MKKLRKKWLALVGAVLVMLALLAVVCLRPGWESPGWEGLEGLSYAQGRAVQRVLREAGACLESLSSEAPGRERTDAMERALLGGGFPVLDTEEGYPDYLGNPEGLRKFCQRLQAGKAASTSLLRVTEDGGFSLSQFYCGGRGEDCCVLAKAGWEEGRLKIMSCELLPVYGMELADWDIFYYSLFPKDPHYIDYMQVWMTPPDREKYGLCRKYILPVGYQMVNCFLQDWEEGDWGNLSINDVFEALYQMETGKNQFNWTEYADPQDMGRARIPAALFEKTVTKYFRISREELRELAGYQEETDSYPWHPFFGDDLTTRSFPFCEPQVVEAKENGDGTVTLAVRVGSPDRKTDCLFSHEVTVRPLADGNFQYVSNQVTEVGQWGLPFHKPRFTLG